MHCPRCGQQQVSGEVRFCKRCGFALSEVKDLLTPESREIEVAGGRKIGKGVSQGLALILFGFVLISILAILRDLNLVPQVFVKVAALIFCVGGLVRMCYPFIYGQGLAPAHRDARLQYDTATHTLTDKNIRDNSLPASQSIPATNFAARSLDTAEMAHPPSVTEHTTKRLQDPSDPK